MKMKKIYTLVLMGWLVLCLNTWSEGSNLGFDQDGYFHFDFPQSVLDMLKERLSDLPERVTPFSFNQEQFEALVNQINELGWCELTDLKKQQIVNMLFVANMKPVKLSKDRKFFDELVNMFNEINDGGLVKCFASPRDMEVNGYIDKLYDYIIEKFSK